MICDYSSWLAFMVAMLRISHDCLGFEGCELHRIVASPFVRASSSVSLGSESA